MITTKDLNIEQTPNASTARGRFKEGKRHRISCCKTPRGKEYSEYLGLAYKLGVGVEENLEWEGGRNT